MARKNKLEYYCDIADVVASRSTCLHKKFGVVIVSAHDHILSTGYNGAAYTAPHCTTCTKAPNASTIGDYTTCPAIHAESNAIARAGQSLQGTTIYLVGRDNYNLIVDALPCNYCLKLIAAARVAELVCRRLTAPMYDKDLELPRLARYSYERIVEDLICLG